MKEAQSLASEGCVQIISKLDHLEIPKSWKAEEVATWKSELKTVIEQLEAWKKSLASGKGGSV